MQAAGGGELGSRAEDAGEDQSQGKITHSGAATEQAIEADLACEGAHGGDVAVGLGAHDVEGIVEGGDGEAALEQDAQALDEVCGPLGEVGEGAFFDLAVLAVGLAEQDGGGRGAVGDGLDVHDYLLILYSWR